MSDLRKRHGWARGLIHFHTQFSDGWASVLEAGRIGMRMGYDFVIITDHLRNLKLVTHRTLDEYIAACDEATRILGIPIIPGGEIEIHWNSSSTADFSEAHTLILSVRQLVAAHEFDWITPGLDPFAHWPDSEGARGTVLAVQEMLHKHNLPALASHQFQHSLMSLTPGKESDYRYDLGRIPGSLYIDFFYSGSVELIHEPEDIELVAEYASAITGQIKGVYASCDFHVGPQVTPPFLRRIVGRYPAVQNLYRRTFSSLAPFVLKLRGDPEAVDFFNFSEEQLSHSTYVYLGDNACVEATILEALYDGRTCVARGGVEFADFSPIPSVSRVSSAPVRISLDLPRSFSEPRPRSVIVFRDGKVLHWTVYAIETPSIRFNWTDPGPSSGIHAYQLYVPSKFLSSPILYSS